MGVLEWISPDPTPAIAGKRLLLRAPQSRDYVAWSSLRRRSHAFLKPFEPRWGEIDLGRRVYASRLLRTRSEARAGTDYTFFIFDRTPRQPVLMGGITLSNIRRRAAQHANLGYWMGEEFAGKGVMSEAVGMVLPFVFENLNLHRVHAAFLPHNQASRRVLEKNGFVEEGFAHAYLQIDGRWADHVLFGLTKERWESRRLARA